MAVPGYSIDDILLFLRSHCGEAASRLGHETDLGVELGIEGDDFDDLISKFGTTFAADVSSYRWHFHHGEEPHLGALFQMFFRAPNDRVPRIPVTPILLLRCANAGKWTVNYPRHSLPTVRYDVGAAWILLVALACLIASSFLYK